MQWEMALKLFEINPAILYQEAAGKNVWFDTTAVSKGYKRIADGLYFCPSSSSTWNKMAILKNLFKLYEIDEDDLYFGLQPRKDDGTDEIIPVLSEAKDESPRCWIVPSNENIFRVSDWLATHQFVYWRQTVNYRKQDTVYLYSTVPTSAIKFKCIVDEIDVQNEEAFEEKEYWNGGQPEPYKYGYARFRLVKAIAGNELNLNTLIQHGLNGAPQKGVVISEEMANYIESVIQ